MAHPNDIGLLIRDMTMLVSEVNLFDWDAPNPECIDTVGFHEVDASHGFSNLIMSTADGDAFRITITRIP